MPKKDAYYFSHDANAQDDPKCMVLIDQLGMEGYGIFWALIEKLRAEKDYKLPLITIEPFAKRWGTSKEKINAVVKNYGLFIIENETFFYSERLKSSMELKSLKAKNSVNSRWDKLLQNNNDTTVLLPNTTVIQNDTIKGKESKVKKKKIIFNDCVIFDKKEFAKYFSDWNKEKLSYYYNAALSYSDEGNKYVNWSGAISNWAKRDELQGKIKFSQTSNQPPVQKSRYNVHG
jgi:L-rhamnose mutarotase